MPIMGTGSGVNTTRKGLVGNSGDMLASALAGGECIDDADALRAGDSGRVLGCTPKASSALGTYLRSFRWGHVRQLDKEGARRHNYSGQRGYHPLLAVAATTRDVLMARLRQWRANAARSVAHFLRETIGRVRYAGATGALTVRADSGFYTRDIVNVCRSNDDRFSITVRHNRRLRDLIEAIRDESWTPISYWMDGAADVAETVYLPFDSRPDAVSVRLIVRRVMPTPGS